MASLFQNYPSRPAAAECQSAFTILCNAHDAASSFLETFRAVRRARNARGAPTDEEQDLLRACLVFAGAGLDSMAKQLVKDALPAVIDRKPAAAVMFRQHVERRVLRDEGEGPFSSPSLSVPPASLVRVLAEIVTDRDPRRSLVQRVVRDLTSGSLQSAEELMRIGAYFDIPSKDLVSNVRELQDIFNVRNQIVHEMDVNFERPNRTRRSRRLATMTRYTDDLFAVASKLLIEVDGRAGN
jgi:hypothetical protein